MADNELITSLIESKGHQNLPACEVCQTPSLETYNHCPGCGHDFKPARITEKRLINQASDAFDMDYGILFTIRSLTLSPGDTIRQYLSGERKKITNPFRYYLIVFAFQSLLIQISGAEYNAPDIPEKFIGRIDYFYSAVRHLIAFSQHYPTLILVPYLLLSAHFLKVFAGHHNYNIAEAFIFNIFTLAHAGLLYSLIEIIPDILRAIPGISEYIPAYADFFLVVFPITYLVYGAWAFTSFYREYELFAVVSFAFVLLSAFAVYYLVLLLLVAAGSVFVSW
ncbi:MAG: DUF3667 domain-containing protein [Bacteroidota bacterium]